MPSPKNTDKNLSKDFTFNLFMQKAQRFCAYQERSVYQTEKKLKELGAGEGTITLVLKKLQEDDFINQERFTEIFVTSKLKLNKWGKIKIIAELKAHKIPEEIISKFVKNIDDTLYKKILSELIIKKNKELVKENNPQLKQQKIINYCFSKGFEFESINILLKTLK